MWLPATMINWRWLIYYWHSRHVAIHGLYNNNWHHETFFMVSGQLASTRIKQRRLCWIMSCSTAASETKWPRIWPSPVSPHQAPFMYTCLWSKSLTCGATYWLSHTCDAFWAFFHSICMIKSVHNKCRMYTTCKEKTQKSANELRVQNIDFSKYS